MTRVGAVVIGRNEGARLAACLASVQARMHPVIYVDSGSHDDSVALARRYGVEVVELDARTPFTAARARNAGFARLRAMLPDIAYVQFVDGDCELDPAWLAPALDFLLATPKAAVVCGRRRERHPGASFYNRLCDYEWDTPVGVADTCGGDALIRVEAFEAAGSFAETLIAGEEPDLCYRIRNAGWTIHRIGHDMTVHDAALMRFGQWWQRNRRSGYACAEALARRGRGDLPMLRSVVSNVVWALPISWPFWPLLWWRVLPRRGALYATFITLGKLPHCQGQFEYWFNRTRRLIEYK